MSISLARSGVFLFCVRSPPQNQLHFMHNSKPVSGFAPTTAGQGCPSQNGYTRWFTREGRKMQSDSRLRIPVSQFYLPEP